MCLHHVQIFQSATESPDFLPALKRQETSSSLWGTAEFIMEDSNYFSLSMKQTDKFSIGKFKYWLVLNSVPPQRASLFLRRYAVDCIISNYQVLSLKFSSLKASWLNVQFLRLFCVSQSTEGLHMFSANLTSHSTAFEHFVKFSIVVKYISLLFPWEKPHTHFILFGNSFLQANLFTLYHPNKRWAQFY